MSIVRSVYVMDRKYIYEQLRHLLICFGKTNDPLPFEEVSFLNQNI